MSLDKNEILPFCTRCFGVGILHGEGNDNFCHQCGSGGTCVPMTREYIAYLQDNIWNRIENKNEYTQEQCKKDTMEHIGQVREFLMLVVGHLTERALAHDQSKLESPELEIFTEYTPKLKNSTYGSDEYKGFLVGMGEALKHHYEANSHHPEHYEVGIRGMNLLDVIEMFCDWKAATMRHADGDIYKSIEHNKNRFNMSDDLAQIFKNTAIMFEASA